MALPGAKNLLGIHYSKHSTPLRELSGAKYGTGLKGAEGGRLRSADPSLRARTFFYPEGYRPKEGMLLPDPEQGLGQGPAYQVSVPNIYDIRSNPLNLKERGNALEQKLKDLGYGGYIDEESGLAVALQPSTEGVLLGASRSDAEKRLARAQNLPESPLTVTAESIPSTETEMGQWLVNQPREIQARYTDELENLLERRGVLSDIGISDYSITPGYGTYQGRVNPNSIIQVPTPEEARKVADTRGYLTNQDAVPFYARGPAGTPGVEAVRAKFDRGVPYGALSDLTRGTGQDLTRSGIDTVDFINFNEDSNFINELQGYLSETQGIEDVTPFSAKSEYNPTQGLWRDDRGSDQPGSTDESRVDRRELEGHKEAVGTHDKYFHRQHGYIDPRLLAGAGGASAIGAGLMMSPEEALSGMQGEGLKSGIDIGLGALSDFAQGVTDSAYAFGEAVTGQNPWENYGSVTGGRWAPPKTEGRQAVSSLVDETVGRLMDYEPPFSAYGKGTSIGEELGYHAENIGEMIKPARESDIGRYLTDLAGAGGLLASNILFGKKTPDIPDLPSYTSPRQYRGALTQKQIEAQDTPKAAAKRREEAAGRLSTPVNYEEAPPETWLLNHQLTQQAIEGHPGVAQTPIQRQNPGSKQAIGSATRPWQSEPNVDLVRQQVERGRGASGEQWYPSTYPIRAYLGETPGAVNFEDFVWANAITSPQSPVPVNMPTATAILTLQKRGEELTTENLRKLHKEIVDKYGEKGVPMFFAPQSRLDQYQQYLDTGMPPEGISSAEKITSYGEGLRGNLANTPLDTHELAGTSYGSTLYPHWKSQGSVPTGVYGPYEDLYRKVLMDMGLMPASGQASRWIGGGELTGLRTAPGTFLDLTEQLARSSAEIKGGGRSKAAAAEQLRMALTGEEPLLPVYSRGRLMSINPMDYR